MKLRIRLLTGEDKEVVIVSAFPLFSEGLSLILPDGLDTEYSRSDTGPDRFGDILSSAYRHYHLERRPRNPITNLEEG